MLPLTPCWEDVMTKLRNLILAAVGAAAVVAVVAPTPAEARCYWSYRRGVEVCTYPPPRVVYRPRAVVVAPPPAVYYAPPPAYYYAPAVRPGVSLYFRG
jgi:hypothetical protein